MMQIQYMLMDIVLHARGGGKENPRSKLHWYNPFKYLFPVVVDATYPGFRKDYFKHYYLQGCLSLPTWVC